MSVKKYFLFLLVAYPLLLSAQHGQYISISAMNESIAFPFTRFAPLHPGLELSYNLQEKENNFSIKAINVSVGWFFHRKVENAFYLKAEFAYRIKMAKYVSADLFSGLGYMHTFYPGTLYKLDARTGEYSPIEQVGRSHIFFNVGLGFTYTNNSRLDPFIRQDVAIETPFANGTPVIVHSFFKIGTNIKLTQNVNK